jgi:DNA-binding protein WhiA
MNNYSVSAKNEILRNDFEYDCCRLAFLSAVVHTAGSVFFSTDGLRIEILCESELLKDKVCELFAEFYGVVPSLSGKHITVLGDNVTEILYDLMIFGVIGEETAVVSGIADTLVEEEHCKASYIKGAFLGSGSVSLKTGYHLEFTLSSADMANDLSAILNYFGINSKIITHNGKYVVYVKDNVSVSDCLALMGANSAVLALNNEVVLRDIRKQSNRVNNCDYANINKTVNASVKQISDIRIIEKKLGLSSLNPKLREMAIARTDNPDATFADLASILKIPKSTVKNRLNKLIEIASQLKEKGENNG